MAETLKTYRPTMREGLQGLLARNWYGDDRKGYSDADFAIRAVESIPLLGTAVGGALGSYDVGRAGASGDYLGAGLLAGASMLPLPAAAERTAINEVKEAAKGIRNKFKVENKLAHSGMTSEDFELRPEITQQYEGPAMLMDGTVYPGSKSDNHATIAERMGFPDGMVPGFYTKDGVFRYQYAEDIPQPPGIRAYHGSPHDFPAERLVTMPDGSQQYLVGQPGLLPDLPEGATPLKDFPDGRFRMDKIGTGEGAQAYGHGLYTADAEGLARNYRDKLARGLDLTKDGKIIDPTSWETAIARNILDDIKSGKSVDAAKKDAADMLQFRLQNAARFGDNPDEIEATLGLLDGLDPSAYVEKPKGRMYEVNIKADPETFLDWDKPLSQQSETVRQTLTKRLAQKSEETARALGHADFKSDPQSFLDVSGHTFRPMNDVMANELKELGIPGIKFLDGSSRGDQMWKVIGADGKTLSNEQSKAGAEQAIQRLKKDFGYDGLTIEEPGKQSSNYVVFDENLIEIIRKYGIAGLLGTGALAASQSNEAQAGGLLSPN